MAAVALRPPLSGYPLEKGVDVEDLHVQQLSQMVRSIKIMPEDIGKIRQKLKEEGYDPLKIEQMIDQHIEITQNLTVGQIPADTLTQMLHEYKEALTDRVTAAVKSAITNMAMGFYWDKENLSILSARIWFDATPDLSTHKTKTDKDAARYDAETAAAEEPVYENSRKIFDRDQLGAELQTIALETNKQFVSLLRRYPLPSRIVIEWKIACPEENRQLVELESYIPILGRGSTSHMKSTIIPTEEKV